MIRGEAKCSLCGKVFYGPSALIIGQGNRGNNQRQQLVQYLNDLAEHIVKEHEPENEAIQQHALSFLTMLRLLNFKTTDAELQKQIQFQRWSINQETIPIRLKDAKLEGMAQAFAGGIVEIILHEAREVLGSMVMSAISPKDLEALKAGLTGEITARTVAEMTTLRDLYEEPGKYPVNVVEVVREQEPPEETPHKPLLVLPD